MKKTAIYRHYWNRQIARAEREVRRENDRVRGPLIDRFIRPGGVGAELGVLRGNFSRVLLHHSRARELHLIDPWFLLASHWDWAGGNTSTVDAVCKVLQENKREIEEKLVFVHIGDDLEVLSRFEDGSLDWAYVDSSHTYEHTTQELGLLRAKVRADGVICGDDWRPDPSHRHHGVYKAVTEFTDRHGYDILYADEVDLQWFIQKA